MATTQAAGRTSCAVKSRRSQESRTERGTGRTCSDCPGTPPTSSRRGTWTAQGRRLTAGATTHRVVWSLQTDERTAVPVQPRWTWAPILDVAELTMLRRPPNWNPPTPTTKRHNHSGARSRFQARRVISPAGGSERRVLGLRLLQDRHVRVGIFPQLKESSICRAGVRTIAREGERARQLQVRDRIEHTDREYAPVIDDALEFGGSFDRHAGAQVRKAADVNRPELPVGSEFAVPRHGHLAHRRAVAFLDRQKDPRRHEEGSGGRDGRQNRGGSTRLALHQRRNQRVAVQPQILRHTGCSVAIQ